MRGRRGRTSIRAALLPLPRRKTVVIRPDHEASTITLVAGTVRCAAGASGEEAATGRVAGLKPGETGRGERKKDGKEGERDLHCCCCGGLERFEVR